MMIFKAKKIIASLRVNESKVEDFDLNERGNLSIAVTRFNLLRLFRSFNPTGFNSLAMTLTFLLCFPLISCSYFDPTIAGPPNMRWMYEGPNEDTEKNKDVDPKYLKGWQQGCETGVSANANHWYQRYYKFRQDANLALDPAYYKGWKDAFNYCGRYIYQYQRVIGLG